MSGRSPTIIDWDEHSLSKSIEARQERILSSVPPYFRTVLFWAVFGFILSLLIQSMGKLSPLARLLQVSPRDSFLGVLSLLGSEIAKAVTADSFSLGSVISMVLTLFANVVMWAFVIWSLTFIPFIAYNSYKVSSENRANVATKPFRWVQLYASTFLPMAAFAIAWNSVPTHGTDITVQLRSLQEGLFLVVGTAAVAGALFVINWTIPTSAISIRLAVLSAIIYASLFLAYGQGYSVASFTMLFGILFYLMFASNQIEEMGRRMVVYDLDKNVARKLDVISSQSQELQVARDETTLSEKENQVLQEQIRTRGKLAQSQVELELNQQMADIQSKKVELIKKTNQAQIEILEQKINVLSTMFDVVSAEYSTKLKQTFSKELEELKKEAQTLPPQELSARMNTVMTGLNSILEGLPETLGELRTQLLQATNEIETRTRLLLADSAEKPEEDTKRGKR